LPSGGEHSGHGAGASVPSGGGQSFSNVLAQAINQASAGSGSGTDGTAHSGGHANMSSSGAPLGLLPTGGANRPAEHGLQETALGLRAYRQQLIASNIANADTPNYKAVDIDFQEALRIARSVANTPPLTLSTTASGHIPAQATSSAPPYPLKYHTPSQVSVDGNTVEMDVERSKFAENALMYQFSLDRVSGHFKMMMELFQTLKD
jgi:flagellar basal-body rod protein FlgB